jgi:hypothetical protein
MLIDTRSLFAEINSWQYSIETDQTEKDWTGRHLLMIGETEEAHFLWASEINFEIVEVDGFPSYEQICHDDKTGTKYGEIIWHDYDSENKIPRFVHGAVLVSKDRFNHIFDLLLHKDQVDNNHVLIELKLFGLELGYEIDDDKWPVDKKVAITDLKLTLSKTIKKEKT